mmetsp:Transcript_59820/g.81816  ORF Transcript_59820/g.81816 Transcript_59820/m.81816 type:complete len:103 (+) Transcript_59820:711-1019(+)
MKDCVPGTLSSFKLYPPSQLELQVTATLGVFIYAVPPNLVEAEVGNKVKAGGVWLCDKAVRVWPSLTMAPVLDAVRFSHEYILGSWLHVRVARGAVARPISG